MLTWLLTLLWITHLSRWKMWTPCYTWRAPAGPRRSLAGGLLSWKSLGGVLTLDPEVPLCHSMGTLLWKVTYYTGYETGLGQSRVLIYKWLGEEQVSWESVRILNCRQKANESKTEAIRKDIDDKFDNFQIQSQDVEEFGSGFD